MVNYSSNDAIFTFEVLMKFESVGTISAAGIWLGTEGDQSMDVRERFENLYILGLFIFHYECIRRKSMNVN